MRSRLTVLVAVVSTAIVASFVIPLLGLVSALAEDRGMTTAAQEATTLAILVSGFQTSADLSEALRDAAEHFPGEATVVVAGGPQLGHPWPDADDDPEYARAAAGEAFSVRDGSGGRVYVPVLVADGVSVVRVTMTNEQLQQGVWPAWAAIITLGLMLCSLTLLLAGRAAELVSRPLQQVVDTAHRLRAGDLDARAPAGGPPETTELAQALNGLADRIEGLLGEERQAVGSLAHRLRTPATALRLETEAVADPELAERMRASLAQLEAGIDAVVSEARRPVRQGLPGSADVTAVVRAKLDHWRPLAEDQGRTVTATFVAEPLPVRLAPSDLGDLVDILLDNVFAHTPEGIGFAVEVRREKNAAVLVVSDDGPGMADPTTLPAARPGTSGLGLEIVANLARAAGGRLLTPPVGTPRPSFRVELPLVADR